MKWKSNTIHLAISFDENYITPFYVLATSIFLNNKKNDIVIHSIASGITDAQKNGIIEYAHQNNAQIFFYEVSQENLSGLVIPKDSWFTVAAYYRLFFPSLVPDDIQKLIYIDADTVVIKDLSELYHLNIGTRPIGAVREKIGAVRPEIGNYDKDNYFNSGVMLIDIKEWRKQEVTEKALKFIHEFPDALKCVDQDALNAVLLDNWFCIEKKFNVLYQFVPSTLPKRARAPFLKDKVIIHYTLGKHKPWCALGRNKLSYIYHQYQKKSPKRHEKMYTDFKMSLPFVYHFAKNRVVGSVHNYPKIFAVLSALQHLVSELIDI